MQIGGILFKWFFFSWVGGGRKVYAEYLKSPEKHRKTTTKHRKNFRFGFYCCCRFAKGHNLWMMGKARRRKLEIKHKKKKGRKN